MSIPVSPDHLIGRRRSPFVETTIDYAYVLYALVLHDIKNRFFGTGLGQIVMVIWPFVHVIVLIVIYKIVGRQVPYGSSLVLYSCTGILPFIVWSYMSRWIDFSAMTNKSFLQYPIVKPLDLLFARALLEIVSAVVVTIMLIMMVVGLGVDAWPVDCIQAEYALGATMFLAFGMGVLNGAISLVVPMWNIVYMLVIIVGYASSGVLFVASNLPENLRYYASLNPLVHCVDWMRSAYYLDYPTTVLDRAYVLQFGLVALTLGLILERVLRRWI